MSASPALIISCEHGGNEVPQRYLEFFKGRERMLNSHRGWDRGALAVSRMLARSLDCRLVFSTTTRLLIDLNCSPGNPKMFRFSSRFLSEAQQRRLIKTKYQPYVRRLEREIDAGIRRAARVIHLSVHSFCPVLSGERRNAHFGVLYDPARHYESAVARKLLQKLRRSKRHITRANYPYRGTDDGLTTILRRSRKDGSYAGIELEINQGLFRSSSRGLLEIIRASVEQVVEV